MNICNKHALCSRGKNNKVAAVETKEEQAKYTQIQTQMKSKLMIK